MSSQKPNISVGTPGHIEWMRSELIRVQEANSKVELVDLDPKQNDVWRKSHKRRFK